MLLLPACKMGKSRGTKLKLVLVWAVLQARVYMLHILPNNNVYARRPSIEAINVQKTFQQPSCKALACTLYRK